jgi:hypothetical protein
VERPNVVVPTIVGISAFFVGVGVGYAICLHRFRKERVVETIVKAEKDDNQPELPFDETPTVLRFESPKVEHVDRIDPPIEEEPPVYYEEDEKGDFLVNPLRGVEDDYWCYEDELAKRSPERPYVIHYDEYRANENDYPQSSIMYYEGDDVVCDELDVPIYTKDKLFGPLLFGHGSMDPNIVFIRNEKIEAEWEILRNPGHFGIEVLGMDEEPIQHSSAKKKKKDKEPIPKFRLD